MAGKIFINYRRGDSIGMAGRLHDRLVQTFGRDNLFMDVDHIPVGVDFATHLNDQLAACDVMLVVIGPDWLRAKDKAGQRRLHQPDDFVAIEITAALARDISVIPVLVERARMPRASELPDALKLLARRQAAEIRHASFGRDSKALVARMCEALGTPIAEVETAGVIEPEERAMIAGVMRLGDRPVRAVMTPRHNVEMIDLSEGLEQVRRRMMDSVHSRCPVHDRSPDKILGVLQVRDVLVASVRGERPDLHALVRAAPVVADTVDTLDVVDILKRSIVHMALVYDEYGHFEGIVTSADILEAIVGDFQTDKGPPEPELGRRHHVPLEPGRSRGGMTATHH